MKTKVCSKCKRRKPMLAFPPRGINRTGTHSYCRPCKSADNRERAYGVSPEQYTQMLAEQGGLCAICRDKLKVPHVDHNHKNSEVRGLLCSNCNRGIGMLADSPVKTLRAALYLLERGNYEGIS